VASRLQLAAAARQPDPELSFATRVRCCTADGQMCGDHGPPPAAGHSGSCRPWDSWTPWDELRRRYGTPTRTKHPLVAHGHWATRGHYTNANVIGLDSGCVYGRPLTAWCLEEARSEQVVGHERR